MAEIFLFFAIYKFVKTNFNGSVQKSCIHSKFFASSAFQNCIVQGFTESKVIPHF